MEEDKSGAVIEEQLQGLLTQATEREQKARRRAFYLTVIPAALAVVLLMGAGWQMRSAQQAVSLANDAQKAAEGNLQSVKLELDNTYGKLAAANQEAVGAREALTDTLQTLELVTGNLVESQNRLARSEVEMKDLQAEVETLQSRVKVYNQQIEELQKSLESVQEALQAATDVKRYTFSDDWLQTLKFIANAYPSAEGLLQTIGENQDVAWSAGGYSVKQGFDSPGFAAYVLELNDRLALDDPAGRYQLMDLLPVHRSEPQVGDLVFYEGGTTMFYFIDEQGVPFVMGMTSQGVRAFVPDFAPVMGYATPDLSVSTPRSHMDINIMIEAQDGVNWQRWQAMVQAVEALGFAGLYRSDHFTNGAPPDKDSLEAWVSLTWLAAHTTRIQFGTLVSPSAFRHPAMLARMAAAVDDLSGGRLHLGLGAGWQAREHTHFGMPLLEIPERFIRFEEYLTVVTSLLRSDTPVDFAGAFYSLEQAVLLPRPHRRSGPSITIGGNGPRRTLPLVARFADEWNCYGQSAEKRVALNARLDALLLEQGRQPADVRRTMMTGVLFARDDADLKKKLDQRGSTLEQARQFHGVIGTPSMVRDQLAVFADQGLDGVMLQWMDVDDLDGLAGFAQAVL